MQSKFFSATVYAKQQPKPLVGDELMPDGWVGVSFKPTPNLTATELRVLIRDLEALHALTKQPLPKGTERHFFNIEMSLEQLQLIHRAVNILKLFEPQSFAMNTPGELLEDITNPDRNEPQPITNGWCL